MDAIEAIHGRRSIRKYTDKPVPPQLIEKLLRAAMAAPSAGNQQPWRFVVIDDRTILDAIPRFHPYAEMLKAAPLAIVVCGQVEGLKHEEYWVQDCAAATQNLLVAAHALGLGAVWLGVYPDAPRVEKMAKLLGLPKGAVCHNVVALGHPAESKPPADRFDPAHVHHNRWGDPRSGA